MVDLGRWSLHDDEPAQVIDLRMPGALDYLRDYYGQTNPEVLSEVLAQVYRAGGQTAVIEFRYIDADYRDEHSRFYSTTFRRYPSVTHRLHFFRDEIQGELADPVHPVRFGRLDYLGYLIARPVPGAPVGRVMLRPPAHLAPHLSCRTQDTVNLFGEELQVEGMPFMAQDAQLLRCAHATLWVAGRYHHLRWRAPRLLPSTIVDAVPREAGYGRAVPSPGLTLTQMSAAADRLGLPPLVYELNALPGRETMPRVVCRYLNSGFPVIVAGGGHAFVLVGYRREDEGTPDERIQFIRQDDEAGPYQLVEDYKFDTYAPWQYVVVPLPNKVYVAGEEAEVIGQAHLETAFRRAGNPLGTQHAFRTTAILSNEFKSRLESRGLPEAMVAILGRTPMSRWIWVVEAVDRDLRLRRKPSVVGEVLVDATDHARDRRPIAWRVGPSLSVRAPDTDRLRTSTAAEDVAPLPPVAAGSA